MTFLSDSISEPCASLLVVCVYGLSFCSWSLLCLLWSFWSCVYNYSGVQRGQSVSTCFYVFGFISSVISSLVVPFPAFVFLSHPIIVRPFPFMSLRLDILVCILVWRFWALVHCNKANSLEINTRFSALNQCFDVLISNSELAVITAGVSYSNNVFQNSLQRLNFFVSWGQM